MRERVSYCMHHTNQFKYAYWSPERRWKTWQYPPDAPDNTWKVDMSGEKRTVSHHISGKQQMFYIHIKSKNFSINWTFSYFDTMLTNNSSGCLNALTGYFLFKLLSLSSIVSLTWTIMCLLSFGSVLLLYACKMHDTLSIQLYNPYDIFTILFFQRRVSTNTFLLHLNVLICFEKQ